MDFIHVGFEIHMRDISLLWWLSGKESACSAEDAADAGSIHGLGRSPGGGHDNPLQHSCLENLLGAWWATVHGVAEGQTQLRVTDTHTQNKEKLK